MPPACRTDKSLLVVSGLRKQSFQATSAAQPASSPPPAPFCVYPAALRKQVTIQSKVLTRFLLRVGPTFERKFSCRHFPLSVSSLHRWVGRELARCLGLWQKPGTIANLGCVSHRPHLVHLCEHCVRRPKPSTSRVTWYVCFLCCSFHAKLNCAPICGLCIQWFWQANRPPHVKFCHGACATGLHADPGLRAQSHHHAQGPGQTSAFQKACVLYLPEM